MSRDTAVTAVVNWDGPRKPGPLRVTGPRDHLSSRRASGGGGGGTKEEGVKRSEPLPRGLQAKATTVTAVIIVIMRNKNYYSTC